MNKEIESVILSQEVSEYQMREIAVKQGMVDDGSRWLTQSFGWDYYS